MKVRVIANPISGGGLGRSLAESLLDALRRRGVEAELYITERAGDAKREAAAPGYDCIASVGGDGTTNEIANGLRGSTIPLAIMPVGTANVVARQLGIRSDPEFVADLIVTGYTRSMDVGLFGESQFLLGAGAGPDGAIVDAVHARRGKRLGYLGYVLPTIRVFLAYRYPKIRVVVDGEEVCNDGHYAIVGNCRFSAAIFPFTPEARIDDGLLDVCVMRRLSLLKMAYLAVASWFPGFTRHSSVLYRKGKEVSFLPANGGPIPLQVDGDPAGTIPATFRIEPNALRVIVPPG